MKLVFYIFLKLCCCFEMNTTLYTAAHLLTAPRQKTRNARGKTTFLKRNHRQINSSFIWHCIKREINMEIE